MYELSAKNDRLNQHRGGSKQHGANQRARADNHQAGTGEDVIGFLLLLFAKADGNGDG